MLRQVKLEEAKCAQSPAYSDKNNNNLGPEQLLMFYKRLEQSNIYTIIQVQSMPEWKYLYIDDYSKFIPQYTINRSVTTSTR